MDLVILDIWLIESANIYRNVCQRLIRYGLYKINRPPRDGHMAFVRSPNNISIEILQEGSLEPKEPWLSMENSGILVIR